MEKKYHFSKTIKINVVCIFTMLIKENLQKVKMSNAFFDWNKSHPNAYLVHLFFMSGSDARWQVGYYDDNEKEMSSFILQGEDNIIMQPEKDVFREDNEAIRPLVIDDVKLDYDDIQEKAENYQKENYPSEFPLKKIYVLQNLKESGQVWNITVFSKTFKTLNMKFNAANGELESHDLANLFEFEKGNANQTEK